MKIPNRSPPRTRRVLAHPPQRIFEAFARLEVLARWWGVVGCIPHVAEPANAQNLDRLQAVLAGP